MDGWAVEDTQELGRHPATEKSIDAGAFGAARIPIRTLPVKARVAQRQSAQRQSALRELARNIAERVTNMAERRDWHVDWTGGGSLGL